MFSSHTGLMNQSYRFQSSPSFGLSSNSSSFLRETYATVGAAESMVMAPSQFRRRSAADLARCDAVDAWSTAYTKRSAQKRSNAETMSVWIASMSGGGSVLFGFRGP